MNTDSIWHYFSDEVPQERRGHRATNAKLLTKLQATPDSREIREQLLANNRALIKMVVHTFDTEDNALTDYDKEEMYSYGLIGLYNAIERTDPSCNSHQFSSYIYSYIKQKICEYMNKRKKEETETLDETLEVPYITNVSKKELVPLVVQYYKVLFVDNSEMNYLMKRIFYYYCTGEDTRFFIKKFAKEVGVCVPTVYNRINRCLKHMRTGEPTQDKLTLCLDDFCIKHQCSRSSKIGDTIVSDLVTNLVSKKAQSLREKLFDLWCS